MTTTNATASSRVLLLLLAVIVAAVASVPGQATAPSAGGQCTTDYLDKLGPCVDFRLGRVDFRGKNLASERERCCGQVREKPNAADCLCTAFRRAGVPDRSDFTDDVKAVLFVCDQPEVSGLSCPASTSG
uniref:Uncharacterized protein n=1 Tax=Avena sativa TaxID=4498 RepID=A0ACD5T823_AVESA